MISDSLSSTPHDKCSLLYHITALQLIVLPQSYRYLIMSLSYACHDHVIVMLSADEFQNVPTWLSSNFKIIEGGIHAGGSSANKLVVFQDGTYLELFTWLNKDSPMVNEWLDKPSGLIDFALTTLRPLNSAENFKQLKSCLERGQGDAGLGVKYAAPKAGGRKRKDGMDVKWEITRPEYRTSANTPGPDSYPFSRVDAPFFCHDVTARVVRVPFDEEDLTAHPCKATGIAAVDVLVPTDKLSEYSELYSGITGVAPDQITDSSKKGVSFKLTLPTSQGGGPVIRVRVPTSEEDRDWLIKRGPGIREIQLSTTGRKEHGEEKLEANGAGSTISLVW